jgi:hypothetical protein
LVRENSDLIKCIKELESNQVVNNETVILSSCATEIMKIFHNKQNSKISEHSIQTELASKFKPLQVEAALNELRKENLILIGIRNRYGTERSLSIQGKQFIVDTFIEK